MTLVFNHDDVCVRVWQSLQPGIASRELTDDWLYVQGASFSWGHKVRTTPQIGLGYDKDEIIGGDGKLSLDTFDIGTDFDYADSTTIKYLIHLYYYDETEQETKTYILKECTPVSSSLTDAVPANKVGREWKVGSYE